MDRTHRGSADRSGMPDTCPAPAAGGAQLFLPAVSRWCSECTRDAGVLSIRRAWCLPTRVLARDAEVAAQDLLTPALLNHSSRAYTWGAAIAALHGITFDRELLYLAAMFHDTGIPSPVPDVDFTVRSAALAREFTDRHDVPADIRELVANAIAMHHTPGVRLDPVPRLTSYLPAQPSMCSAYAATRYPMQSARASSRIPAVGLQAGVRRLLRAEARQVPRGRAWYLRRFAMTDLSVRLAPFRD